MVLESLVKKGKYMLFAGREVRIGKNCTRVLSTARGLEQGPWPAASGRTQDLRYSFSQYGPPGRQITYIIYVFITCK